MTNYQKSNPKSEKQQHDSVEKGWKSIASIVGVLIAAPILAIFITIFVFQSYEVFGQSMETTLQNGDRLIVQKLSKNWSSIRGKDYIPQRYEIIVFDKPISVSNSGGVEHLIKRVIGLPGERVVVRDGNITVYNQENPNGFNPDDNQEYAKDILTTSGNVDITVGENEIFVNGDNRGNSFDSRNFGAINVSKITGVAVIRFIPVGSFTSL
jgi:signal peptidase I